MIQSGKWETSTEETEKREGINNLKYTRTQFLLYEQKSPISS